MRGGVGAAMRVAAAVLACCSATSWGAGSGAGSVSGVGPSEAVAASASIGPLSAGRPGEIASIAIASGALPVACSNAAEITLTNMPIGPPKISPPTTWAAGWILSPVTWR